ncbi:microtubule-associated protein futsch isoform X2 [Myzus persicae]|uniref:microtubule-associated protein futsch isoform X2 n=1 Tax=Myzus persicae TaxID=13164 RepID=UPI000B933F4F|nr:microtubule-associated protein futsch isoform X2 [Myzus persicae]
MGNPSDHVETPLTGGYLLIVLAEPRSAEHKLAILKKLTKGLSCWNYEESGVDIVTEFNAIVNQNIEGEEGKNGEQLFQYASDNLVAEILINPQHSTLVQCVRNLLASFTKYRCIIHAGYSFTENGSWILQDGSFSVTDFLDAYKTAEAQRTIRLHENQIRIELHCSADADWNQVGRVKGTRFLLNPPEKIVENGSIESIVRWLCDKIEVAELDILLEGSQVVGNIRFSRPTLYVFPAGQGDSALFGINGFNMLIDGGAGRNSCFWGFARHLDRLDAVLLTRLNSSNLEGVASFLKRKTMSSLYPQIGHFFCNFKTRKQISSPDIDAKQDILSISLIDTAQSIITDLKQLQLRPHLCYRNINLEPINLYHKVGHGKLDMYVLNPSKDSKEVKDFLAKWNEGDQKLFNSTKDLQFPLPNIISVCTLLVWQPANPNTTITRILFPGSCPQNKIFESLERVRHLEFLKHPSCSIKSMSSSTSVTVKSQTTKKTVLEKMIPGETKTVKTMENLEVSTSASNAVIQTAIIPTVPKEGIPKPKFPVETDKPKPSIKSVTKETSNAKPKIEHKYSSISAKVNSNKVVQKSSTTKKSLKLSSKSPPTDKSSPTTPIENQEKAPKPFKQVIKPKSTTTTSKSPSSTPTKSKKEEANRKVLVSSRTNSGLKRTPITKKEIKPAQPKITETSLKKDPNIVYKSSLISCDKDKSGEEEDILIVEKVAITPEKLLTPDGKKIIANELDGILTTAKDIVTKEKLSDSGATTAPTMPEDEKITESKKEIEVSESDKKIEEFKKAKDALKTPDEVADLPFHEEADEQKPKITDKEIESEIETQEIVQVENAEYVLVSLDSSPEVLKRQVLDTVGLLDTELEEDSDKEDEYAETKQSSILPDIDEKTKLIEHLLESSKDLCEITDKIDELKKQNEHEITNHQIHDHLDSSNHDNTKTSNMCTQSNKQENPTLIQEGATFELQEEKSINEQHSKIVYENNKDLHKSFHTDECNAEKRGNSEDLKQIMTTQETDTELKNIENKTICQTTTYPESLKTDQDETKMSTRQELETVPSDLNLHEDSNIVNIQQKSETQINSDTECEHQEKTTTDEIKTKENKSSSRSSSICEEHNRTNETKLSTKTSYDEPLDTQEIHKNTDKSGSTSLYQEQDKTNITIDKENSKASNKTGSVCDEPVKSPVHETITATHAVTSRSGSIIEEPENVTDMQRSKASSRASSVCDEHVKSPVHDTITATNVLLSRSSSTTEHPKIIPDNGTDMQKSKASSKASSVCDEPVKSPVHETITATHAVTSRSGSIAGEPENVTDMQRSKASSRASSVCDEPVRSPVHDTNTATNVLLSRSSSTTEHPEIIPDNGTDMQKSKASSKASSVCDEPVKSPVHETITATHAVTSRSGSIVGEPENVNDMQRSKASSKASSICDEPVKSPVHEKVTATNVLLSRSSSITEHPEIIPDNGLDMSKSKASSKGSSVCDEPVKSPVHETITATHAVTSRSGSIAGELENVTDMQRSKASSRASSVCDEPVKSPVHETITATHAVTSRSGSIAGEPENVTDMQRSKASSRASSVCDEPVRSPVHDTNTATNVLLSRSSSTTEHLEIIPDNGTDMQKSKTSSKASSICDEPVKSPVHETITATHAVTSRSGSITQEPGNTSDMQKSKASSRASSICDEPVKSPVHEMITATHAVTSRSGSIAGEPENVTDMQKSKASSKASSICDEPLKSPVHETITATIAVTSRSGSITEGPENTSDMQKSKASSRASSVCDEPVKSPVQETITATHAVTSRSGSIAGEPENVIDMQRSKVSSKASSICDEPVKSPVHETIIATHEDTISSGFRTIEHGSTLENVTDIQESKTESTASSVCGLPTESHVNDTVNALSSTSSSITQVSESIPENDINKEGSSKSVPVCDEPVKSPLCENIISEDVITNISSSMTQGPENITDNQCLKASSQTNLISEEPVNSSGLTLINTNESESKSISSSVNQEQGIGLFSIADKQQNNSSSKDRSICDEISTVQENISSNIANTSISNLESTSINILGEQELKTLSKSVCDELLKSPGLEIDTEECVTKNTLNTELDKVEVTTSMNADYKCDVTTMSPNKELYEIENKVMTQSRIDFCNEGMVNTSIDDHQEPKVFNNEGSTHREPIKYQEKNCNEDLISNKTNSREELLESLPTSNNCSTVDDIISDKPLKEQKSISTLLISENSSLNQDTECALIIGTNKHDFESCSIKDSFDQDKNKSSTFSSSSTSSICQEIDTQSSKLSSRKSSVVDETIDNPSKLQIMEKSSSLQESNVYEHSIDDNSKIFNKSGSLCDEMLNLPFTKVTENIISNKAYEQAVSSATTIGSTESKINNEVESMCEESIKSHNNEICTKENLISSISSSIHHETEDEKCQLPRNSSVFDEPQNLLIDDNTIILSPSDNKNKSNVIEKKPEESKSLGRIGSLCEEIAKFLTDNDNKTSTIIKPESQCSLNESLPLKSEKEELEVETETLLQLNKNTDTLNKVEKSLQLDDKVKVDEKHDNVNEKNTDHSLPVENITVSNNKSPNISTLLIEENNKTGIMNVAQIVGKNITDESLTKHTVITDNESKNLKTVTPTSNITSEECISKLSNVLIEDVVKTSDDKNRICDSSITDICMNQPLGVTLNIEDLGVTKDIVMQLKRDVHEALHPCSSDDERPFTPHSESSMSRSAMNIDDDDDDNEDNKIETDDDMPGSPMSTGPSPVQMQLDNRHVEINMDFNKAMQEHRITRGEDLTTTEANGNHVTEIKTTKHDNINQNQGTSSDTVQSWGKPLGLPPVQSINNNGFDPIREWGKPLGLPSPTQPILELAEPQNMSSKTTPKKNVKKIIDNKPIINVMDKDAQNRIRRSESPSKLRSRSSSRMSRINPIYLDLIYVPHHGNSKYVSADFFKRVRARNYVFSGTDPSKEVLNALIEGKQAWEDQDLEVTIIPTYDTDTLGQWVAENEELLNKLKIDLSPSASRCTIKLQDHNTSCSAYRLEF